MAKIMVHRVKRYDISADQYVISKRLMTEEGARKICGEIISGCSIEIDDADLEHGEQWTPINFRPDHQGDGVQRQVFP